MKITTIETKEEKDLSLIDPKTGLSWTNDLMGNYGALPRYDDESDRYLMSQKDFDWWADLIARYQEADDRFFALTQSLRDTLGFEAAEELAEAAYGINCDLENYPEALQEVCDAID